MASTGRKMTKHERKVWKKQMKMQHTLMKHENITISDTPTQNLYVGNGGLGNDVSREDILDLFRQFGSVVDVIMPLRKPYSFLSYSSNDEATEAFDKLQEYVIRESMSTSDAQIRLYLSYIKTIPGYEVASPETPPGLHLLPDFVSEEEEIRFLDAIDWEADDCNLTKGSEANLKHRRVKHYGYEFLYGVNNVDKDKPLQYGIPGEFNSVISKMMDRKYIDERPDQLTVNQYQPGQGIPPHVDTHSAFTDWIASVSLGSQCVMDFRHPDGRHFPVLIPRRCCVIMTGESRYMWTHGITPRKSDIVPVSEVCAREAGKLTLRVTRCPRDTRTSLTFRKLRDGPCKCAFPRHCDSQQIESSKTPQLTIPLSKLEASKLEQSHVHSVYEEIAGHFSDTRHTPWPRVVEFLNDAPKGSLVVDIGCGNGKYLYDNNSTIKIGSDRSQNLCDICRERGFEVFCSDILAIPLRRNLFDRVICIAVIHHLSTSERRKAAIQELADILCPGGQALLYVWALEQEKDKKKSNYLCDSKIKVKALSKGDGDCVQHIDSPEDNAKVKSKTPTSGALNVHINRTHFESQDLLVPWNLRCNKETCAQGGAKTEPTDAKLFHRYYHVFVEGEIERLLLEMSNVKQVKSYYDKGNWCVIIEKV